MRRETEKALKRRMWRMVTGGVAGIAAVIALAFGLWNFNGIGAKQPNTTLEQSNPISPDPFTNVGDGLSIHLGGDLDWWQNQMIKDLSPEGKTVAGFMVSLLQRGIGTTEKRSASIDQYFESSQINLKEQLEPYDVSSPQVKEAYLTNKIEDPKGVTYTFKTILVDSVSTVKLEDTLEIHVNNNSHKINSLTVKMYNVNDWHAVSKPYFVQGTVVSTDNTSSPAWTYLNLKIERYIDSEPPPQDGQFWIDGQLQIGKTATIAFYNLADKGKNNLKPGERVIVKIARYTDPAGTIAWGSTFNDVFYEQNRKYNNPEGKEFIQ